MKKHKKTLFLRNSNKITRIIMHGCDSAECVFEHGSAVGLMCTCAETLEDLGRQLTREAGTIK